MVFADSLYVLACSCGSTRDPRVERKREAKMTLFSVLVVMGFGLWFASSVPGSRVPEWSARLTFFIAAIIWLIYQVGINVG